MPRHEVLIVGGGVAGLRAAIAAKLGGRDVAVLSKTHPTRSHSVTTQDGINAPLGSDDSWEAFTADTVKAGDYLCDQDAVETLCQGAEAAVFELDHWGVPFQRNGDSRLETRQLAAATAPRSCYVGDLSGHMILNVLYEQILKHRIPTYDEFRATTLLVDDGGCRGVAAIDLASGRVETFEANAVVLATGGFGRAYAVSAASEYCSGDGLALAYAAGVALCDLEMVQFHPCGAKGRSLTIGDAVFGLGAKLKNAAGERFMAGVAGEAGELAPRDISARAAAQQIADGRGEDGCVFLDATEIDTSLVSRHLDKTHEITKTLLGVDFLKDRLPVQPTMYRSMGGIAVGQDGATSLPGLFAAGECASINVHGAGRLGGNTLLEGLIFGARAGSAAAAQAQAAKPAAPESLRADEQQRIQAIINRDAANDRPSTVRNELSSALSARAGVVRDAGGLEHARQSVAALRERYGRLGLHSKSGPFNFDLVSFLDLGNLLDVAEALLAAADARQESRGAHFRADFPSRNDETWLKHTLVARSSNAPQVSSRPVTITRWQPDKREY